jgi:tetratricopeptide (TPR) repeat protein
VVWAFALALAAAGPSTDLADLWRAWAEAEWAEAPERIEPWLKRRPASALVAAHQAHLRARRTLQRGDRARADEIWRRWGSLPAVTVRTADGRRRRIDAWDPDGALPVGRWLDLADPESLSLQAWLQTEHRTRVTLRFGVDGPWRLSVDDTEVATGSGGGFDAHAVILALDPGRHRIAIRTRFGPTGRLWLRAVDSTERAVGRWLAVNRDEAPPRASVRPRRLRHRSEDPVRARSPLERAFVLWGLGRTDEARTAFDRATDEGATEAAFFSALSSEDRPWRLVQRALQPDHGPSEWLRARALADRGLVLQAEAALMAAHRLSPDIPRIVADRAAYQFDVLGEPWNALRILGSAPAHPRLEEERLRLYEAVGDRVRAEAAARRAVSANPLAAFARRWLIRGALARGDRTEAQQWAQEARVLEPAEPGWWMEPDPVPDAVRRRFPDHFGSRPTDRPLPEPWAAPPPPALDAATVPHQTHPGATMLSDRRLVVYEGERLVRRVQQWVRLEAAEHAEAVRVQTIGYAPGRERLTVRTAELLRPGAAPLPPASIEEDPLRKVDGMYVDATERRITFDDVRAGDVVHLDYAVETTAPDLLGGFFGSIEPAQGSLPVRHWRLEARFDPERPLFAFTSSLAPALERSEQRIRWEAYDLPALSYEPMGPAYTDRGGFVSLSSVPSWDQLSRWYAGLVDERSGLDSELRRAGRTAAEGSRTPVDAVRALFRLVTRRIRYVGIELGRHGWEPDPPPVVWRRGYGDCKDQAVLLSALLADQGIESRVVLVRTADRGGFPTPAPTMWAFNHAVLWIEDLNLYVDPTVDHATIGILPPADQGAVGLVVGRPGPPVTLPVSTAFDNANWSETLVTWSDPTRMNLSGSEHYRGATALSIRRLFEARDERRRTLERHLGRLFPGVEVAAAEFEGLDGEGAQVSFTYDASIHRPAGPAGRTELPVSLFQPGLVAEYAGLEQRSTAIVLEHPWQIHNRVEVQLPPGARVEGLPDGAEVDDPYVRFEQRVKPRRGGFVVEDTVVMPRRTIPPSAYPAFRDACRAIDRLMNRPIDIRWR